MNDLMSRPEKRTEERTETHGVCLDAISRAKAIDALDEIESEIADGFGFEYEKWRKYFCDLPPAQPERIKGHWIKISPANIYECSECGKSVMTNDICAYDFCHGCGADMREVTT